eukprot:g1409.t1
MATESSRDLAVRVLFAGACQGQFFKLLKKVEKVNAKNGPFDALFCIGQFFPNDETEQIREFNQFLDSDGKMPITTYILGAYGAGCQESREKLRQMDCNVHLLGKRGILKLQNGLSVAYLEGMYDADASSRMEDDNNEAQYYTAEDITCLRSLTQAHSGDIDFFLSCEWPANITMKLPPNSLEGTAPAGSPYISTLLSVIRPRYHFTSQPPLFFSRSPYKNPDLGAGSHVTRFTSLCPFATGKKQNLFALCLTPAQHMSHEKLLEIPTDATEFPFDLEERKRNLEQKVTPSDISSVVDSSSCTSPGLEFQLMNHSPTTQSSNIGINYQASTFYNPQTPLPQYYGTQESNLSSNTRSQLAIQTLMQNIGRNNALHGLNSEIGGVRSPQGTYGNQNLIQSNVQSFQDQIPVNPQSNLSGIYTSVNQLPASFYLQRQQTEQFQTPLASQNVLTALLENPQLLNTAVSLGLLPPHFINTIVSPSISMNQNYTSMQVPQGATTFHQDVSQLANMNPDLDKAIDMNKSNSPVLSSTDISQEGRNRANQQLKRQKKTDFENNNIVKDRRKTCFVGQLPFKTTKDDIINYFSQAGEVAFVIKRQTDDGQESNWAFVQYTSQEAREEAVKTLNHTVFAGKRIVVRAANDELKFDPNEPVKDCWFCLGSPSSDKGLIVSIGNESYLTVDKGPIVDEHVLIIPTSHYPSTLRLTDSCYEEMELYLTGLRALFASEGKVLIAFERYLQVQKPQGNHTHLSVISIDPNVAENAMEAFINKDKKQGADWHHLPIDDCNRDQIRDVVGDEEYLLVILPDGSKLVRPILKKNRLPVSFGRDVLAHLVGAPERADWKICLTSREEELARVETFKAKFHNYDYPNKA